MATAAVRPVDLHRPEVIVDFTCRGGILYVILKNVGARSAYGVTTVSSWCTKASGSIRRAEDEER